MAFITSARRPAVALLVLLTLAPNVMFGQTIRAGVVTTSEGNVTVARTGQPAAIPLRFKQDVFIQDKITTGDRAFARLLLGGSAVVTVRERSTLTITEIPGKSTIALDSGKIALAVAREKMKAGDSIEIRTPNAIAGVRGTVVVAEVIRASAQLGGGDGVVTNFSVLKGSVEAFSFDAGTGRPVSPPQTIGTLQRFSAAGSAPPRVDAIPPSQVSQVTSGLSSSSMQHTAAANAEELKEQAVQTTVTLMNTILGTGTTTTTDTTTGETTQAASEPEKEEPATSDPPAPTSNEPTVTTSPITPTTNCTTCTDPVPATPSGPQPLTIGDEETKTASGEYSKLTLQTGGTLEGTGTATFTSTSESSSWSGGHMTQAGTTQIHSGHTLAIEDTGAKFLDGGRILANDGLVNWTGGDIHMGSGTRIDNTGTMDIQFDNGQILDFGAANPALTNSATGTIKKSTGNGMATIFVPVENLGTIDAQSGTIRFETTAVTNTGGTLHASNGAVVELLGTTVTGGTLITAGTGEIRSTSTSTLNGVDNQGTVKVPSGTLSVDGGTHSGTFSGGGTLEFTGGTTSISGDVTVHDVRFKGGTTTIVGGTFNPTASITTVDGGTANFDVATDLTGSLTILSGVLGGSGALSVASLTTWSGGTMNRTGPTTTSGGLTIDGAGDRTVTGTHTLTTPGTTTWSGGRILIGGSATISNTGTWNLQNDLDIASTAAGATGTFTNTGTFTKSMGAGTATIGADDVLLGTGTVNFNNQGLVHVQAGTLQIGATSDGGSTSGRVTVDAGATLIAGSSGILVNVSSGTHNIANTSGQAIFDLTGSGTANETVDGVSLTLGTDRPLRGAGTCPSCPLPDALITASGATINTEQGVKLDTALADANTPVAVLASGASLTSSSDFVKLVQKTKVQGGLGADAFARLTASTLTVATGGLVSVAGGSLFEVTSGKLFSLDGGSSLTIQNGALVKVAGNSVFRFTEALGAFGTGTNTLALSAAASCGGPCPVTLTDPETGATFGIQLTNGAVAGNVVIKSGYDPFTGLGGSNSVTGVDDTKALIVLDGASSKLRLGSFPSLTLPPDYAVNANETYSSVTHSSGTLSGGSTLTVLDSYAWSGGTQTTTSGITEITSGAALDISGADPKSLSRRVNNSGTTTWTGTGNITAGGSSGTLVVFDNKSGALFDIQNDQTFGGDGGSAETFTNAGTVQKTVATSTTTFGSGLVFNNSGTVDAQTGAISFGGTGTHTGTFNAAAGATITFAGNQTFNGGTAFTGAGVNQTTAGSSSLNNYATADNFTLAGGTLSGTAVVSGSGFTWTGGTMSGGGTLTSTGTFTFDGSNTKTISGYTLANTGTATWTGTAGNIASGGSGVVFDNRPGGLFLIQRDAAFEGDGASAETFRNSGTVRKTVASGATTFGSAGTLTFDNPGGTLDIQTGSLTLSGAFNHSGNSAITAGTIDAGSGGSSSGSLALSSGVTLNLTGGTHSLATATTVTGSGLYRVNGGSLSVAGTVAGETLALATGAIEGTGTLSVTGSMTWTGGNMQNASGTTALLAGTSLTMSGASASL